ncbi:hypothetical protein K2D_09670 [Planctomycetes bacterium K2D]|uniref:Uncharacterized protein n=2 Tax=Botrimarina mediterranea TaxID=2528022 RepID=A0A518K4T5_9BACT|nr:hypothetical protein Spa11_09840 [Botrimarina mediterranea]QDV77376.1 hypothetical protein K2D_09670 [Planctomycetes bacterium K2D]
MPLQFGLGVAEDADVAEKRRKRPPMLQTVNTRHPLYAR